MKPKRPAKSATTSYARQVDADGRLTGWRLFRRSSVDRRVFIRTSPAIGQCRSAHARQLWIDRQVLRAVVDKYDLEKLGVTH